jgi:hypothetical protein
MLAILDSLFRFRRETLTELPMNLGTGFGSPDRHQAIRLDSAKKPQKEKPLISANRR